MRITPQLIRTDDDTHAWANAYNATLDDIFAVQSDIAQQVTQALEIALTDPEQRAVAARPTESLDAYDLYLKGREAYYRDGEEQNEEAARLLQAALDRDPTYAVAWAGLADTFAQRADRFGDTETWGAAAEQAARRAVQIDADVAEAHTALGNALKVEGRLEAALSAYRRAVELSPDEWPALSGEATIYYRLGRFDEAVRALRQASRLAPTEVDVRWMLAHTYKFLELDDEANEWNDSVLVLDPDYVGAWLLQPQLALYAGETQRALALTESIVTEFPDDVYTWVGAAAMAFVARDFERAAEWAHRSIERFPDSELWYWHDVRTLLGISLVRAGDREHGLATLEEAKEKQERRAEIGEDDDVSAWNLAAIHAALGNQDTALQHLQQAYDYGFRFARWPPVDPAFDSLRDDPRYRQIMARMSEHVAEMKNRVLLEEQRAGMR